jgi:hypothetical protein
MEEQGLAIDGGVSGYIGRLRPTTTFMPSMLLPP